MKGLLLKDFYMTIKYCKAYLLLLVLFIALSFMSDDNFYVFYPCLISGMLPSTLLGIDERSKWLQYSNSLPYSKAQVVSIKFIVGLLAQLTVIIATAITQIIKMNINGNFVISDILMFLAIIMIISSISSSVSLPFMFKYGVEKGRIAYYVMIGIICGASVLASHFTNTQISEIPEISFNYSLIILCLIAMGIYASAWYLSVVFYKKRDIN